MRVSSLGFAALLGLLGACAKKDTAMKAPEVPLLRVTSTAYAAGADVPPRYTCEDKNVSPPVAWAGTPAGARSVAVIMDDPDAPRGTWVHWVVYNLPAENFSLGEGDSTRLPGGARAGKNDFGDAGYGGPCPPSGTHRYVVKVYALDISLPDLGAGATKATLEQAMRGHILAQGELMAKYQKTS